MPAPPQKHYWDRVSDQKRFAHPLRSEWLASYIRPGDRILDCGCGYGRVLEKLHQSGYPNAVGADSSAGMLRRCRELAPQLTVVQGNAEGLPFRDGSFDAVLLFAVLTTMPADDQQRALFSEVERVLRTGGLIYISDLLLNQDARNVDRYERFAGQFGPYGTFQLPDGAVFRHNSEEWVRTLTSNFKRVEYERFTAITMNGHTSAAYQYLGRKE